MDIHIATPCGDGCHGAAHVEKTAKGYKPRNGLQDENVHAEPADMGFCAPPRGKKLGDMRVGAACRLALALELVPGVRMYNARASFCTVWRCHIVDNPHAGRS
jgi:hypothetical protein